VARTPCSPENTGVADKTPEAGPFLSSSTPWSISETRTVLNTCPKLKDGNNQFDEVLYHLQSVSDQAGLKPIQLTMKSLLSQDKGHIHMNKSAWYEILADTQLAATPSAQIPDNMIKGLRLRDKCERSENAVIQLGQSERPRWQGHCRFCAEGRPAPEASAKQNSTWHFVLRPSGYISPAGAKNLFSRTTTSEHRSTSCTSRPS
jgi:hypothetical protein